jgi:RNA polymerase sigma factor (sigma-70 family)
MLVSVIDPFARWANLVNGLRCGDENTGRDLRAAIAECALGRLRQCLGAESADDQIQEIAVVVLDAIHRGKLRSAERLMGFVKTVARRRISAHIRAAILRRRHLVPLATVRTRTAAEDSPEARLYQAERMERVKSVLGKLMERDREILVRFYLFEESKEQICQELHLTGTQFRLFKSRAVAKCVDLSRRHNSLIPQGHCG